jgi:hypothetical protein
MRIGDNDESFIKERFVTIQPSFSLQPAIHANLAKRPDACECPHQPETPASPGESVTISQHSNAPASEKDEQPGNSQASPDNKVKVSVYQQDPYVAKPILMEIPRSEINSDFTSPRVVTEDNRPLAKPDAEGNFILADGSDGVSQVNAHVITNGTLRMFEGYRGREIDWAVGRQLSVTPHKQEGRNAYYSRWAGTNYFYSHSPGLGREMKTANSADVVSHETGHALLDGLRPGFFSTHDDETGAFHEAFGDCAAMLYGLTQTANRDLVARQTEGDLRKINATSSLAEDFGAARVLDNKDPSDDHKIWLRQAINAFTYKPPSQLPDGRGSDTELGREVHSFSRLFSGAFYDCIEAVYNQARAEGKSIQEALRTAEQVNGPALLRAIETGSPSRATFKEIALGMIAADRVQNGGKYGDGLKQAFINRKIITASDIKLDEERLQQLPAVQLPEGLSKSNALDFLEANAQTLGLPVDLPYVPERVSSNGKGETFVSFRYSQEVPVTVEGLQDKVTDVQGGVNLVFDASGKLIDRQHTQIDSQTIDREMKGIANLQRRNAIIAKEALALFKSGDVDPTLFKSAIEGNKIVRIPISGCYHDEGHCTHDEEDAKGDTTDTPAP